MICKKNQEVQFDKTIVIASSYESKNPVEFVLTELSATSVSKIQENNANYWEKVWSDADIVIESDHEDLQRMVRMNIFHIRQAAQHGANQFLDASVGSRGLTGEAIGAISFGMKFLFFLTMRLMSQKRRVICSCTESID